MRLAAVVLCSFALFGVVGCGDDDGGARAACVVNAAGAELCGESAAAYCRSFAGPTGEFAADLETLRACESVGVDVSGADAAGDAFSERVRAACVKAGGDETRCGSAAAVAERGSVEVDEVAACVRGGSDPVDCVEELGG